MAQALLDLSLSSVDGFAPTPTRAAWVGLALLTLINLLNYLGGYVVPAMGESLMHSESRPTDAQFGYLASGFITVYRLTSRAYLWAAGIAAPAAASAAYLALRLAEQAGYWTTLVGAELLVFACTGPINSTVVSEAPAEVRASAMGVCIFTIHILGDVPSPPLIGAISDAHNLEAAVMLIPVAVLAGGLIWTWAAWDGNPIAGRRLAPAAGGFR